MSVALGLEAIPRRSALAVTRDYVALTKPRVVVLLEVTAVAAMIMAAHGLPRWELLLGTVVGGWLAAAGANAINCWFDRDIDADMGRTRSRPLPAGRIDPNHAFTFGIVLAVTSFVLMSLTVNLLAATLTMTAFLFYVLVYTMWLKRSSMQNIVIGGAAGAIPPLVGWAAVDGQLSLTALFLFAIVFYWTPPHFWALALRFKGDYAAANVPMMPVVRGDAETARQIVLYTLLLFAVSLLLFPTAEMGLIYLVAAVGLGAAFVWYAVRVLRDASDGKAAIGLFRYSISYLTLLFAAVAIDSLIRLQP